MAEDESHTAVRIKLPTGVTMTATFPPNATVEAVFERVSDIMAPNVVFRLRMSDTRSIISQDDISNTITASGLANRIVIVEVVSQTSIRQFTEQEPGSVSLWGWCCGSRSKIPKLDPEAAILPPPKPLSPVQLPIEDLDIPENLMHSKPPIDPTVLISTSKPLRFDSSSRPKGLTVRTLRDAEETKRPSFVPHKKQKTKSNQKLDSIHRIEDNV